MARRRHRHFNRASDGWQSLRVIFLAGVLAVGSGAQGSIVDVTSPTTSWTAILYGNNNPDPSNDQQTGSSEGDIVGNASHPSVYTTFGDGNTLSLTDGVIAFRVRLGADVNPSGFKTALFVGIDGNADGALDLFIGVNNSGSADTVGLWNPGAGLNVSPNTTTIVSTPLVSYTETATNYNWTAVTAVNDPTVNGALDIDGGGKNDYFLSFSADFADIVAQLSAKGISGFNENSTLSYVISTATQANSLNQDLNGVGKNFDGASTWSNLGVLSSPMTPAGKPVIPEANPALIASLVAGLAIAHRFLKSRRLRRSARETNKSYSREPIPTAGLPRK